MKKILLLFALLPLFAWGQKSTSFSKSGSGDLSKSDTASLLATQYDLATAVGMAYPGAGIPLSTGAAWGTSITNNSTNWNTAYTDRLKWDGGATGLVAATGRTSLGATTVGEAFFTLTNPSAVTFVRINADNSITAQSAANFKTDLSLQNVTNESKATMFTNPTFTGTVVFPSPFTLGGVSVTTNGTELNVLDNIPGTLTSTELGYVDGVTSAIQTQFNNINSELDDTVSLETIVTLQADTIPLATFGLGSGRITDTALFQNNVLIGSFYNKGSDSLIITSLKCYLYTGSGTESVVVNIAWSDTIMAVVPIKLNTSGYTTTNHVVGMEDTSFNNATIPPNKLVYGWITGNVAGNKPSYLSVTLSGHKINRSY